MILRQDRAAAQRRVLVLAAAVTLLTGVSTSRAAAAGPPDAEPRSWLAPSGARPAAAATPAPAAAESRPTPWRGVLVTLAILGLGAGAVLARRSGRFGPKLAPSARLRVLSSVRIAPKSYVVLVAVGERVMLLGATDSSIRRLAWVGAEQVGAEPEAAPAPTTFGKMLRDLVGSRRPPAVDEGAAPAGYEPPTARREPAPPPQESERHRGREPEAALLVAKEQRDALDWSPELRRAAAPAAGAGGSAGTAPLAPKAPLAGAQGGPGGRGAEGRAGDPRGGEGRPADGPTATSGDVEEQATGLARRRRRK